MGNLNVKKGDTVMVIAGKDKGKAGEVMKVDPSSGRIVVKGVNEVYKHVKPRKAQEKGGIIRQEGTIDSSNVMVMCPSCQAVTRVKHSFIEDGGKTKKIRVCAKCGANLDGKKLSARKAARKIRKASKAKEKEQAKPEVDNG